MEKLHHRPDGGFRNPWPGNEDRRWLDFWKWQWQRLRGPRREPVAAHAFPRATPRVAEPRAAAADLRVTWFGQSTFLVQIAGLNLLTDPVFSLRASPFSWLGPARFIPVPLTIEQLPPIDAVILSHDHYDHLDAESVKRLAVHFPAARWIAPLRHTQVLQSLGAAQVTELDWWENMKIGELTITATPSKHWTRRVGSPMGARLWFSCALRSPSHNIYFCGDSGYCPAFIDIGRRLGPFDAALMPIGAYEPRWFMQHAHMNPEESVRAHQELQAQHFLAMHWATFRLTDEHPLEPADRARSAWRDAALLPELLHVLAIGETFCLPGC